MRQRHSLRVHPEELFGVPSQCHRPKVAKALTLNDPKMSARISLDQRRGRLYHRIVYDSDNLRALGTIKTDGICSEVAPKQEARSWPDGTLFQQL
jgi:hypothetical protein